MITQIKSTRYERTQTRTLIYVMHYTYFSFHAQMSFYIWIVQNVITTMGMGEDAEWCSSFITMCIQLWCVMKTEAFAIQEDENNEENSSGFTILEWKNCLRIHIPPDPFRVSHFPVISFLKGWNPNEGSKWAAVKICERKLFCVSSAPFHFLYNCTSLWVVWK